MKKYRYLKEVIHLTLKPEYKVDYSKPSHPADLGFLSIIGLRDILIQINIHNEFFCTYFYLSYISVPLSSCLLTLYSYGLCWPLIFFLFFVDFGARFPVPRTWDFFSGNAVFRNYRPEGLCQSLSGIQDTGSPWKLLREG